MSPHLVGVLEIWTPSPYPLNSDLVGQICIFFSLHFPDLSMVSNLRTDICETLEQIISVTLSPTHVFTQ